MKIPYKLVSMAMVLKDYVDDLPYMNDEHERLVEFADVLVSADEDSNEVVDLLDAGYDPSDLITKYDESYFISVVSAYMAIEEYLEQDGDIDEIITDYLQSVGYKAHNPNEGIDDIILFNTNIKASEDFIVGTGDTFTFNSPEEIYGMLVNDVDLYCVDSAVYMFKYNEVGAIAFYVLSEDELYKLAQDAYDHGANYIGGELGVGGRIIDVQIISPDGELIDYDDPAFSECYANPNCDLDITDIYDFLRKFVGQEFINANVDALVKGE